MNAPLALPARRHHGCRSQPDLQRPLCDLPVAQAGADVIKVEPKGGEHLRRRGVVGGAALPFAMLNANKRSVSLDLKNPQGRDLLIEMVRRADVLVENFAPGVMERLGLGVEAMHKINPRLVYAQSSGYGQDGLYRDYPAMDLTVQAMSGVMDITGFRGPRAGEGRPGAVRLLRRRASLRRHRHRAARSRAHRARAHRRGRDARCGLCVARLAARHVASASAGRTRGAPATATAASRSRPTTSIRPATATSRSSASASSTGRTCSTRWSAPICATTRASQSLKTRVAHMDVVDDLVERLHQAIQQAGSVRAADEASRAVRAGAHPDGGRERPAPASARHAAMDRSSGARPHRRAVEPDALRRRAAAAASSRAAGSARTTRAC